MVMVAWYPVAQYILANETYFRIKVCQDSLATFCACALWPRHQPEACVGATWGWCLGFAQQTLSVSGVVGRYSFADIALHGLALFGCGCGCAWGQGLKDKEDLKGIIPRSTEYIFERVNALASTTDCTVAASYVEIYMEKIRDLLDRTKTKVPPPKRPGPQRLVRSLDGRTPSAPSCKIRSVNL